MHGLGCSFGTIILLQHCNVYNNFIAYTHRTTVALSSIVQASSIKQSAKGILTAGKQEMILMLFHNKGMTREYSRTFMHQLHCRMF